MIIEQMVEELAKLNAKGHTLLWKNLPNRIQDKFIQDAEFSMPLILRWIREARINGQIEEAVLAQAPWYVKGSTRVEDLKRQINTY